MLLENISFKFLVKLVPLSNRIHLARKNICCFNYCGNDFVDRHALRKSVYLKRYHVSKNKSRPNFKRVPKSELKPVLTNPKGHIYKTAPTSL